MDDVCKQIYKSSDFGEQLDKQSYFKEDITNLIQSANDDYSKVALIFTFVKQKVNWNGYYNYFVEKGVKRAYKDGSGNIAEIKLMLTSMLRFAGLNANPVLVSTRSNGVPIFPTLNGFDYVITKVNFSDNTYILLDASEKYSFPNILPERCLNWSGRELLENATSTLVNLVPKKHSQEIHTLHLKLNDDLTANGMLRTSYSNHFALFYRDQYNDKKEEDQITRLENKYNVEIDDYNILNKNDLSKKIVQSFKFTSSDLIEEINGKVYITPLLFLAKKENPFKTNERNFPIDFTLPIEQKYSVSIAIPEGYTIESAPENLAIGLPENLGVFKYQVSQDGSKIRVIAQFQINTHIISPEYYTTLKDFYRQLVTKQTEKIVVVK
ncbi:transglutaminase domain-containing protein [Tenacibaculum sp. TC6]|uniref:transglutaminase domain-containing protein n=1 Tax=Tenacibaculum sp. TC6 TaxID=3423223 RepID=UPI003D35B7EF